MTRAIARAQTAAAQSVLEARRMALATYFTERCQGRVIAAITVEDGAVNIKLAEGTWLTVGADWLEQCLTVQLDDEDQHLV
jgi:hypothetical protein